MKARIIQIWAGRNIGHQKEQTGYYEWKNEIKNKNLATRIRTLEWDGQLELQKYQTKNPAKQGDAYHTFFGAQHC